MLLAALSHGPAVSVPCGEDAERAASSTRRGANAAPPLQALWRESGGTNGCRNVGRDGPGSCHDTHGLPIRLSVLRDTWRAALGYIPAFLLLSLSGHTGVFPQTR